MMIRLCTLILTALVACAPELQSLPGAVIDLDLSVAYGWLANRQPDMHSNCGLSYSDLEFPRFRPFQLTVVAAQPPEGRKWVMSCASRVRLEGVPAKADLFVRLNGALESAQGAQRCEFYASREFALQPSDVVPMVLRGACE